MIRSPDLRLQHSYLKFWHIRIQRRRFERLRDGLPRFHGIDDFVDLEASGAVAGVGLLFVGFLG